MFGKYIVAAAAVAAVATAGCDDDPAASSAPPTGELTLLTYNVAGLPEGISKSHPATNHPQIGPLLNGYDLVLVQEDFCYHDLLVADVLLPNQSPPEFDPACTSLGPDGDVGDGLNRYSTTAFEAHTRHDWETCHGRTSCGADCLTRKGFSFARHTLGEGVQLDVYNLHLEAGSCSEDLEAKAAQVQQLIDAARTLSGDRAIVIGGDSNLHWDRPSHAPIYDALLAGLGASDSCALVACGDEDRIDRFVVRGSDELALEVRDWWIPDEFVDSAGEPLSDHRPVAIRLGWAVGR